MHDGEIDRSLALHFTSRMKPTSLSVALVTVSVDSANR